MSIRLYVHPYVLYKNLRHLTNLSENWYGMLLDGGKVLNLVLTLYTYPPPPPGQGGQSGVQGGSAAQTVHLGKNFTKHKL
jgi:hypothetical protein